MQNYNSKSKILKNLKRELPKVQRNISLAKYTTFKIGGRAKYFLEAKNKADLIKAVRAAKKFKLPFFILGRGGNVLVADEGFDGLIIKIKNSTPHQIFGGGLNSTVKIDAGTPLSKLVDILAENGLTGLEWAIGIPGTVGGAVYGNAGAFGSSMATIVKNVEVLEIGSKKNQKSKIKNQKYKLKIKKLNNKDCRFSYRNSIFKENKNLIILSVELQLKKGQKKKIKEKIREYLNYRKENQPLNLPSAGSVFKNPPGFSAGELIEKCGLKGERIGNAKISEKHANFIVNLGGAKSTDVKKLIAFAKKEVKKKFKIELKEEIQYL